LNLTDFDGYRWQGNETISLYDPIAIRERDHFLSVFRPEYFNFA
jgi:hypothetical protein